MQSWHLRLLALVVLLASAHAQSISPRLARAQELDRKALLSLKASTMAAGPSRLRVWKDTTKPCGAKPWPYVTCTDGRVTGLNVANLGLAGTLPDDLRRASELVTLNLADNKFVARADGTTIPDKWVNQQTFRKLKTLNLANNNFIATLPALNYGSVRSTLNIFRALESLDLSGNKYYGALPQAWLDKHRVLRQVKYLDLSSNALGYQTVPSTGIPTTPFDGATVWCTPAAADGWCPSGPTPTPGTLASLEIFDISNNDITAALPVKWPVMMPRLTSLLMHGNFFAKELPARPSPLPDTWSGGKNRGFSALQSLYLYPGNAYLCSIPDDSGDYRDVNLESAFKVLDSADGQWGVENPAICPVDTASTDITFGAVADTDTAITVTFAKADVYGYKVTISKQEVDFNGLEKYVPLDGYVDRYRRVWEDPVTPDTVTVPLDGAIADTADGDHDLTVPAVAAGEKYKVTVIVIMMDGGQVERTTELTVA